MTVTGLELDFFRNYLHLEARFSKGVNVIYGENAQGKTNLLEAVYYMSAAQSNRTRFDKELIQNGVDHAFLKAEVRSEERDYTLEARLSRNARKQLLRNGVRLKTGGELAQTLQTVFFSPEDLLLIRAGAAARRKFLNECICQLRPRYAAALTEYQRLYDHKTRILRDHGDDAAMLDTLADFNLRMAQTGAMLIHYRAHFVRKLAELTPPIHLDFSGGREKLSLRYETVSSVSDPLAGPKELLPQLLYHQETHRRAELEARQCLTGPHKDDLIVELDGLSAKSFASQGQTRTAALSLKLASRELFYQDTGQWPVLLLDDVLSELDARRQEFVLRRITSGQVFITCCQEDGVDGLTDGKVFQIREGKIV